MAELDLELLASIASGGLGSWVQGSQGRSVYVKSDDCLGGHTGRRGGRAAARALRACRRVASQLPQRRDSPPACACPAATCCLSPRLNPCLLSLVAPLHYSPPAGCLRDLQRFFRYDDPEHRPAFFAVSKYNFARSDLVPLVVTYPDDYDVLYNAREWLVHGLQLQGRQAG
jgi:hypothetical protein